MFRHVAAAILLLFQATWPVHVAGVKENENKWNIRFSHIPSSEKIGAFKINIRLSTLAGNATVITDAPSGGPWSQIKPELSRKGNLLEILCVGPAMLNSRITDTTEMFRTVLDIAGNGAADLSLNAVLDSIWFSECFDPWGNTIVPRVDLGAVSVGMKEKNEDRSSQVHYRSIGRIHHLTFNLSGQEAVKARVVDIRGRQVAMLLEGRLKPGMHTLRWPENSRQVPSGTYFIQLEINSFTYNKKVHYYK